MVRMLRKCALEMPEIMDSLRESMDREEPGWTDTTFFCPFCRDDHVLVSEEKQFQLIPPELRVRDRSGHPDSTGTPPLNRGIPPLKHNAPEGWCRWHESASSQLTAPCAYCRTPVHVHQDALGRVKSGREGKGYLVQRCPACHRFNAVHPVYSKKGIRTSKLEDGAPVMQLTMGT